MGACSLCPDSDSMSMAVVFRLIGTLPTDCTASVWNRAPWPWASSAISSTGNSVPVSLLAHITETTAVLLRQQFAIFFQVEPALAIDRKPMDDVAVFAELFFDVVAQVEDGGVFDGRRDDLAPFRKRLERRHDGGGVRLGPARGEDDLGVVLGPEQFLHLVAGLLERLADAVAEAVHRRRVAELLREERQHRLDDLRIDLGGRVVVQVDISHG